MSILDTIKNGIKGHIDKKKRDQEMADRMRLEFEIQRSIESESRMKNVSFQQSKIRARRLAQSASGIQRLRAVNRSQVLESQIEPPSESFLNKLSEYTQRNKARTEENLKKTKAMRSAAKQLRDERQMGTRKITERRPFGGFR